MARGTPGFPQPSTPAGRKRLLQAVFDDAQDFWRELFDRAGLDYRPAALTFFHGAVDTGCGEGLSELGPFYCPADHGVYLDLGFFDAMQRRFGMHGSFSEAYVVAHEVAHHVQTLTGVNAAVSAGMAEAEESEANRLSVRRELQADCYAGVWAHSTYRRDLLGPADLRSALDAAAIVGNDVQQAAAGVPIISETWTHGSATQRRRWLARGFAEGRPDACDTFSPAFDRL